MKHDHHHQHDVNVKVDLPKEDIVDVVDKITESAIVVIAAATAAHILKSFFK